MFFIKIDFVVGCRVVYLHLWHFLLIKILQYVTSRQIEMDYFGHLSGIYLTACKEVFRCLKTDAKWEHQKIGVKRFLLKFKQVFPWTLKDL